MGTFRTSLMGLAAASAVVAGTSLPALAGSMSKTYYGGVSEVQEDFVTATGSSPLVCGKNPGVTEACFHVPAGTTDLDVSAKDQSGQKVPMRVWYYDDAFARTDPNRGDSLCSTGHVVLPDGTTNVDVRVGPLGRGASSIPPAVAAPTLACGTPQPVTTGTITITGAGIGAVASASQVAGRHAEPGTRQAIRVSLTQVFAPAAISTRATRGVRAL